jgi:hypothetical protein
MILYSPDSCGLMNTGCRSLDKDDMKRATFKCGKNADKQEDRDLPSPLIVSRKKWKTKMVAIRGIQEVFSS